MYRGQFVMNALARAVLITLFNDSDDMSRRHSMFNFNHGPTLVFCFSLAAFATGCGNTATITRVNAPELDGEIRASDSQNIYIKTAGNTPMSVPRETITDIDHPGNVAATIGAIVTGYGIANIAMGAGDCDRGGAAYCTGVFLPAAIGLPIMSWGLYTWINSTTGAKTGNQKESSVAIVPTISVDKKNEYVGVSASMRF